MPVKTTNNAYLSWEWTVSTDGVVYARATKGRRDNKVVSLGKLVGVSYQSATKRKGGGDKLFLECEVPPDGKMIRFQMDHNLGRDNGQSLSCTSHAQMGKFRQHIVSGKSIKLIAGAL